MKTKFISAFFGSELEKKVNEFIKEKTIEVIDIKYQIIPNDKYMVIHCVMIVYKDEESMREELDKAFTDIEEMFDRN